MNDDRGVSGVLINSEKGRAFFDSVADRLFRQEISAEDVRMDNGGFSGAADNAMFSRVTSNISLILSPAATVVLEKPVIRRSVSFRELFICPLFAIISNSIEPPFIVINR